MIDTIVPIEDNKILGKTEEFTFNSSHQFVNRIKRKLKKTQPDIPDKIRFFKKLTKDKSAYDLYMMVNKTIYQITLKPDPEPPH